MSGQLARRNGWGRHRPRIHSENQLSVKPSRWYSLANGGGVPSFVLVNDRASWADMEPPE
jgi:hypothetical protein